MPSRFNVRKNSKQKGAGSSGLKWIMYADILLTMVWNYIECA